MSFASQANLENRWKTPTEPEPLPGILVQLTIVYYSHQQSDMATDENERDLV